MGYKVYKDINTDFYIRRHKGEVGKSHSVVRTNYINMESTLTKKQVVPGFYPLQPVNGVSALDVQSRLVSSRNRTLMLNNVVDKFEGKCGPSAALGSSIFAEGKETVAAAVGLLERQANICRAMLKRDVKALKALWTKPTSVKDATKRAGGKWLEFNFGWIPLVQTVYDAMAVTCGDFPPVKVNAKSTIEIPQIPSNRTYDWNYRGIIRSSMKIGYDVSVENPNTWLLGSLGLINPIEWIWEAIPYSFFVDYFINVGDLIHNLSSFAGLQFSNGYTTLYTSWDYDLWYKNSSSISYYSNQKGYCIGRQGPTTLRRQLVLADNPLTSSWRRGANAASFIVQFLK